MTRPPEILVFATGDDAADAEAVAAALGAAGVAARAASAPSATDARARRDASIAISTAPAVVWAFDADPGADPRADWALGEISWFRRPLWILAMTPDAVAAARSSAERANARLWPADRAYVAADATALAAELPKAPTAAPTQPREEPATGRRRPPDDVDRLRARLAAAEEAAAAAALEPPRIAAMPAVVRPPDPAPPPATEAPRPSQAPVVALSDVAATSADFDVDDRLLLDTPMPPQSEGEIEEAVATVDYSMSCDPPVAAAVGAPFDLTAHISPSRRTVDGARDLGSAATAAALSAHLDVTHGSAIVAPVGPPTQWIDAADRAQGDALTIGASTLWRWRVTPLAPGPLRIAVRGEVGVVAKNGRVRRAPVQDRIVELRVRADTRAVAGRAAALLVVAAAAALLGWFGPALLDALLDALLSAPSGRTA